MDRFQRLPAVVQGLSLVILVSVVGILPPTILDEVGFRLTPRVPWFLPATLLWMWMIWRFLSRQGWWREHLCVRALSWQDWSLALGVLAAGTLAIHVSRMAVLRLLKVSDVSLPAASGISTSVLLSSILVTSLTAGLFEEAAYRGYLRSLLQDRYGVGISIVLSALVFTFAHLSRGREFFVVLPLAFLFGCLYGAVAWKTGSIWPGIVVHTTYNLTRLLDKYMHLAPK